MAKILILEDDHARIANFKKYLGEDELTICETADEAIAKLDCSDEYDTIMLDHDLGGEQWVDSSNQNTGAEVARHIAACYPIIEVDIVIHSMNPDGAENMRHTLSDFRNVRVVPFSNILRFWKTLE